MFSGDAPPSVSSGDTPRFWVEPTEEQKNDHVLDIHDHHPLTDVLDVATADERRWLEEPLVALDGKCPKDLLTGDEKSRERLSAFLTDAETAIRGAFS